MPAGSSESDTSSEPSLSPSPPASPNAASLHQDNRPPPTLEQLVQHFVSSKRALSTTASVWRANEIVTTSRALLEEIAVLNAKNFFARRGVDAQIDTLHAIRDGLTDAGAAAGDDFRATIDRLDLANERLEKTLNQLRSTKVDPSLPKHVTSSHEAEDAEIVDDDEDDEDRDGHSDSGDDEDRPSKTLYHFIDETRHEELRTSLRDLIDSFNDARGDLDDSVQRLDESIQTITGTLSAASRRSPADPTDKRTIYDDPPPSIPQLFHSMEEHAAEMAALLQSLVSHYDLCVTALKHTEGGGEAAARALAAAADEHPTERSNAATSKLDNSLYGSGAGRQANASSTMDAPERRELLRVLEKDAQEVEDVVGEMSERAEAMESLSGQLQARAGRSRSHAAALSESLVMLREMRHVQLAAQIHALSSFRAAWETIHLAIAAKSDEVAALCEFHDAFLGDYDKLLREVERRQGRRLQVRKVVEKARKEIAWLEAAEADARKEFLEDVGRYLPKDLWPAMKAEPVRWEVRPVVQESLVVHDQASLVEEA